MGAVVFGFVWLPHVLLLIGRAWTSSDGFGSYFVGHLDVLWETALATLVYLVAYGALAFLVAVYSSRPALAVFLYLVAFYSAVVTVEAMASAGYEVVGLVLGSRPCRVRQGLDHGIQHPGLAPRGGRIRAPSCH